MPEIRPDMSDGNRCVSVHWNLPMQCVLPASHRENWHEAWHPQTGNRLRYQRSMGGYATEELHHGTWHDLQIPPPGGFCGDQFVSTFSDSPSVRCTGQYGHGWNHRAIVDGCTYSWNTPIPKGLNVDQLTRDVKQLRGMVIDAHARIAELETAEAVARGGAPSDDLLADYAALDFAELMEPEAATVVTSVCAPLVAEIKRLRAALVGAREKALDEAADWFEKLANDEPEQGYRARVMRGAANDIRRLVAAHRTTEAAS